MQCPNCRAQVTTGRLQCSMNIVHGNKKQTITKLSFAEKSLRHFLFTATVEDIGVFAWIAAGVMCAVGE